MWLPRPFTNELLTLEERQAEGATLKFFPPQPHLDV